MTPVQLSPARDGHARKAVADGCHHADVRILSRAMLTADGLGPEPIAAGPAGPGAVEVVSLLRGVDEPDADPTAQLRRLARIRPGIVCTRLKLTYAAREGVTACNDPLGSGRDREQR